MKKTRAIEWIYAPYYIVLLKITLYHNEKNFLNALKQYQIIKISTTKSHVTLEVLTQLR